MTQKSDSLRSPATTGNRPWWRGRPRPGERGIEALLIVAAAVSIATTIGILIALTEPTVEFFEKISFTEFFTHTEWTPLFHNDPKYGMAPLLLATLVVTAIGVAIAVPLGLGSATYLSEYANSRTRKVLKPILEILAGVPTVVYGAFALFAFSPILRDYWPGNQPDFQNMLIAGVAMGVMIVPTVASLAEDAMSAVPLSLREGAYALSSSKMQVSTRVVVPAAMSGIVAAVVLGLSRAIGETMIVTIAAGSTANHLELNPLRGAETMTAYIANAGSGDLPVNSFDYRTIFAIGAVLFVFTFLLNALSIRMVRKFREVYE